MIGRVESDGTVLIYGKDHLGSVRAVWERSYPYAVTEVTDYYPFGLQMPGRSYVAGTPTRENYTGHELDDETGLLYAGARYMDPTIGRFLSVDPLAGDFPAWSPYNYALNNPLRLVDPDGAAPVDAGGGCPPNCDFFSVVSGFFNYSVNRVERQVDAAAHMATHPGEVADAFGNEVQRIGNEMASEASTIADGISNVSTGVAIVGIVGAPFTKGLSLTLTADALAVGTVADVASTGIKGVEALNGGSATEFYQQGAKTLINVGAGRLTKLGLGQVVTRTGPSVVGPMFRSAQTGRFVTNRFGLGATAAADATAVGVSLLNLQETIVPDDEEDQ